MKLLVALTAFFVSSSAFAVSFDCAKASTFVEKTICSDPLLGKLDDALSSNYKAMLGADFGGPVENLRNDQRKWIANRNKCTTRECLVATYRERVDETCEYGVVSGVHPDCVHADDIEASQAAGPNGIQNNPANAQAVAVPDTSLTSVPKAPVVMKIEDAPRGTVGPAKAEILGFHLYMTGQEVLDLIKARYNLKPTYDRSCNLESCLDVVFDNENASPFYPENSNFFTSIKVSTPSVKLEFYFTTVYPANSKRPEVTTAIKYYPQLTTKADITAFNEQVIAKFGKPNGSNSFEGVDWCLQPVPRRLVGESQLRYECDEHLPLMTLHSLGKIGLEILDNQELFRREQKQWESEKQTVLPPL